MLIKQEVKYDRCFIVKNLLLFMVENFLYFFCIIVFIDFQYKIAILMFELAD